MQKEIEALKHILSLIETFQHNLFGKEVEAVEKAIKCMELLESIIKKDEHCVGCCNHKPCTTDCSLNYYDLLKQAKELL